VNSEDRTFKFRKVVSFSLFILFLILCISGFALYIKPEGDIANWIGWRFLGLDKEGWEGFHALFSLFFLVCALMHLLYNLKVLILYLKQKVTGRLALKKEFCVSAFIVTALLIGTVMRVQPFWKIAQWRQALKKNRGLITVQEPEPGFHKRTIGAVAEFFGMPARELVRKLNLIDIRVTDTDKKLIDVAHENNMTPEKVYIRILEQGK